MHLLPGQKAIVDTKRSVREKQKERKELVETLIGIPDKDIQETLEAAVFNLPDRRKSTDFEILKQRIKNLEQENAELIFIFIIVFTRYNSDTYVNNLYCNNIYLL